VRRWPKGEGALNQALDHRLSVTFSGSGVPAPPTGLCFLPASRLALDLTAGMLPGTYSRVLPKPPAAYGTGSLPGLWHGDDYRHHSLAAHAEFSVHARWVSFAEQGWVTSRERRRYPVQVAKCQDDLPGCTNPTLPFTVTPMASISFPIDHSRRYAVIESTPGYSVLTAVRFTDGTKQS